MTLGESKLDSGSDGATRYGRGYEVQEELVTMKTREKKKGRYVEIDKSLVSETEDQWD